jgi:hypothetical protein
MQCRGWQLGVWSATLPSWPTLSPPRSPARNRRWRLSRRVTVLASVLLVALVGAGIATAVVIESGGPPALILSMSDQRPDPNKGISGGSFAEGSETFSMQLGSFQCAKRAVTVTSISLYKPTSGIQLQRWGFANTLPSDTNDIDHPDVALTQILGGIGTSHTLTRLCTDPFYARLCLQLQRTQPGTQAWLGLRVVYRSDGENKVAYVWEQYQIKDLGS